MKKTPRILSAGILVACVLAAIAAAHADHWDVCHGFVDFDDMTACQRQADAKMDLFVSSNPHLFSPEALVKTFTGNTQAWATPLIAIATALFWSLALVEFILTFSMMAIRGSDLGEFAVEFLTRVLIISFGAYLLSNHAILFSMIDGFRDTASMVRTGQAGNEFVLARLLQIPLDVVSQIYKAAEGLSSVKDFMQIAMIFVTAVIVLWALSVASVQLILVLCEMYIVITIGLLSLGFFSLKITREYPMRFFGGLIGTGFKLLALELIISIGLAMVDSWSALPVMHKAGPYMLMAAAAIMYKEIAVRIPDYIQSLLTASPGSGVSAAGAVTAAGTVAGAGAAGAVASIRGSASATMSVRDAARMARGEGATGAGAVVAGTVRHLAGAVRDQMRRGSPLAQQIRENLFAAESSRAVKSSSHRPTPKE